MEALKTKQSKELQQHSHQIHAVVSHQNLSFHLADDPCTRSGRHGCISHIGSCTLSAVLICVMMCEQEDALASLQEETEAKAAMITDLTTQLQQLQVSMDDQAHGFRTEATLLQATNSTQGRQVCQLNGCAIKSVALHHRFLHLMHHACFARQRHTVDCMYERAGVLCAD